MLEQQRQNWALLAQGEASFAKIVSRSIEDGGSTVIVQSNPGRRVSTGAKVDPKSVAARPCFLCEKNLPTEERGVAFGEDLVIFANPFPIVADHLSIVSRAHVPQQIAGRVEEMFALARGLGPEMMVIYNGPACGASAPDHFHFQAGASRVLPITRDLARVLTGWQAERAASRRRAETGARIHSERIPSDRCVALEAFGRRALVFRGSDARALALGVGRAISSLGRVLEKSEEPMINIVASFERDQLTAYLFPREKHRPACFFATGEDQILWSPGALDMAGIAVIADPDHYDRVTSGVARAVYEEVSVSAGSFRRWTEVLS
jgi:hypothetical protein